MIVLLDVSAWTSVWDLKKKKEEEAMTITIDVFLMNCQKSLDIKLTVMKD